MEILRNALLIIQQECDSHVRCTNCPMYDCDEEFSACLLYREDSGDISNVIKKALEKMRI